MADRLKNVVYVLGAGFSAYAGLPVMSNFIDKAKDIINQDKEQNTVISEALTLIREYSVIKNYMNSNLMNIEELLSIYDMKQFTSSEKSENIMKSFIISVISYYEKYFLSDFKISIKDIRRPEKYDYFPHTDNNEVEKYFAFLYSMYNLYFQVNYENKNQYGSIYQVTPRPTEKLANYGIITFNYDTILEKIADNILHTLSLDNTTILNKDVIDDRSIRYCKLHGSIEKENIIPPTWAKTNIPQIKNDWRDAHTLLKNANEIRLIGFSFPETDNHVSFLFKSALIENENLKSIDVICLDPGGIIKERYQRLFVTDKFRFSNSSVGTLFDNIVTSKDYAGLRYTNSGLETAHTKLFSP